MANFKQGLIKKLLMALLVLLIPVGGLIFLARDISHRAETIKGQRQELANRSEEMSFMAKLQSQSAEAEPYLGILENVLPSQDQLFDFPKEMERLATQEGVGFGFNFTTETQSSPGQPGRMGLDISTGGSLYKIFDFIKSMENSRFLVNFNSFDFTGTGANIKGEVLFY